MSGRTAQIISGLTSFANAHVLIITDANEPIVAIPLCVPKATSVVNTRYSESSAISDEAGRDVPSTSANARVSMCEVHEAVLKAITIHTSGRRELRFIQVVMTINKKTNEGSI
jgi:hypothetical protein